METKHWIKTGVDLESAVVTAARVLGGSYVDSMHRHIFVDFMDRHRILRTPKPKLTKVSILNLLLEGGAIVDDRIGLKAAARSEG